MKDTPGYEGKYAITSCGRVWSYKHKRFIKSCLDPRTGYYQVCLYPNKDKTHKIHLIHRLVAETYLPNPDNLPCINHKDENKANNSLPNLEWCTYNYNANYGTRNERISKARKFYFMKTKGD